ncbi:MAG TPA: lipocalin-like domain-containing protein [Longimicrobiales bacterium]|nr:lipocalin-like domain-containing protein [Longimicrobiales bacterium]
MGDLRSTRKPLAMAQLTMALAVTLAAACDRAEAPAPAPALDVGELLGGADTLHARAVDVPAFTFPADHGPHPEFRTEWWYWTGNLTADDGREFGYQLTFFRSALVDSATYAAAVDTAASAWRSRHAWMAHFAVSDIGARSFHHAERFARDAVGLAGAQADPFRVWLGPWQATGRDTGGADAGADGGGDAGRFPVRLEAADGDVAMDLVLAYGKPMVLQGDRGLSRKGPEPGNASYYYSFTRMPTTGTIRIGDRSYGVTGLSWLDREWSTSALSADLAGWDWMALQLDDGTELMLYRLRRHDGTAGEFSAGSFVDADGASVTLAAGDFAMTPMDTWRSPLDGTAYPVTWQVAIPRLAAELTVSAAYGAQEMDTAVRYWEGAVRIIGTRAGAPVTGRGYLEMTGY